MRRDHQNPSQHARRSDSTELTRIVYELTDALHEQAKELDTVLTQVEQVTTRLPELNHLAAATARFAELHVRVGALLGIRPVPSDDQRLDQTAEI
jgi:ABC-type transporter Mla subunit MlaD